MTNKVKTARALLVIAALSGVTAVFGHIGLAADPARLDGLVASVSGLGAAALSGWLALAIVISALATLPGAIGRVSTRAAGRVTPAAARRVVHLVLGVSVAAGTASLPVVASAAPQQQTHAARLEIGSADDEMFAALPHVSRPAQDTMHTATTTSAPSHPSEAAPPSTPGWTPSIPAPSPTASKPGPDVAVVSTPPRNAEAVPGEVVVRRGDSLWAIAARVLGPSAGEAEIAATWPQWFDANRAAIGPDPDVIRPGTVLRPPT